MNAPQQYGFREDGYFVPTHGPFNGPFLDWLLDPATVDRLPFWVLWLDWCQWTYRTELLVFLASGLAGWLVYCFARQGWALG